MIMDEDVKKLVIERIDRLPSNIKISIGNAGSFTKNELIENVKDETPIGNKIAEIQLTYIRSFTKKR